jgi:TonB family protein
LNVIDWSEAMLRMLRIVVCIGLLLSGLLFEKPALQAQEAATMNGAKAVRFEQSPGFFNYISFCVTPKDFLAQMPEAKLPGDKLEYGLCWYVDKSKAGSSAVEGKLVVSEHHVRFVPDNPQFADAYIDIPREQAAVKHEVGQNEATLVGKGQTLSFRLSKLCLTCAAGTPTPPGVAPALLDQDFALLEETILHYYSGWRQIYHLSSGTPVDSRNQGGNSVASAEPRSATRSASRASASADLQPASPSNTGSPAAAPKVNPPPAAASGTATLYASANSTAAKSPAPLVIGGPKGKPVKIPSADGMLVKKVPPDYPLEAKLVRLEGTVMLRAVIDRTGEVSEVSAVSGPPLLESAAVDAVKQWQYRPYSMNGQPVDVETTIAVVFALDGGSHPASNRTRASASRQ